MILAEGIITGEVEHLPDGRYRGEGIRRDGTEGTVCGSLPYFDGNMARVTIIEGDNVEGKEVKVVSSYVGARVPADDGPISIPGKVKVLKAVPPNLFEVEMQDGIRGYVPAYALELEGANYSFIDTKVITNGGEFTIAPGAKTLELAVTRSGLLPYPALVWGKNVYPLLEGDAHSRLDPANSVPFHTQGAITNKVIRRILAKYREEDNLFKLMQSLPFTQSRFISAYAPSAVLLYFKMYYAIRRVERNNIVYGLGSYRTGHTVYVAISVTKYDHDIVKIKPHTMYWSLAPRKRFVHYHSLNSGIDCIGNGVHMDMSVDDFMTYDIKQHVIRKVQSEVELINMASLGTATVDPALPKISDIIDSLDANELPVIRNNNTAPTPFRTGGRW